MIKIKTKEIKDNKNSKEIGVIYKVKDADVYEHLVLIRHLILKVLETKEYSREEVLKILKMYI